MGDLFRIGKHARISGICYRGTGMPIYIDVSSAVHAKAGIGRYASSLARALASLQPGRLALFYNRGKHTHLPAGLESLPARTIRAGYKPWRMAVWLGQLAGVGFDRLVSDAELFHATEHLLLPLRGVPTVLTVHDMIFKLFPQYQKRLNFWYLNATMPLYCRRADAIVTVSESSKRDIVTHYGLDPAKVTVIYEGASPEFVPAPPAAVEKVRRGYGLPDRFLLHVGTIEPRKNLTRLVEALQQLRDEGVAIPLVVAGGKGWLYDDFFRRLEELPVRDDVHFPGYIPADDLPMLYNAATMVAVPSVYEGFGLPVLEAMACGTPVVCSDVSSLPEIGGGAARYFDPYDVERMVEAIRAVWTDADLQAEMGQRGLEQAAKFSWERAAQETLIVYGRIMQSEGARS
jgi:glycosyltransferase involved in cell wall biosynthesis